MPEPSDAGLSPATVEAVAGLGAGAVATLVVHPLDLVKTRLQLLGSSAGRPSTAALLAALAGADRPVAALYRGLAPNLVGNAAGWACFFRAKARLERALAGARGHAAPSAGDFFAASAGAGALTTALTNPVWVLKTRMLALDRGAAGAYPTMREGVRRIYAADGLRGFYRGLGVSLLGVAHGAVQFAVYEPAKRVCLGRGDRLPAEATLALSTAAKLVAAAATYPHQVLRSRLQNVGADERFGRGLRAVVVRTWRDEGVAGFYRGLVPGVVRVMPATWVTFLVYENVKYYLPRWLS